MTNFLKRYQAAKTTGEKEVIESEAFQKGRELMTNSLFFASDFPECSHSEVSASEWQYQVERMCERIDEALEDLRQGATKIKINYRHPDGTRTSATIAPHIYLTWADSLENAPVSRDKLARAMVERVESGLKKRAAEPGQTQQERIEALLMADVRDALWMLPTRG